MKLIIILAVLSLFLLAGCSGSAESGDSPYESSRDLPENAEELVVAGGCFWCVEADLEKVPGVVEVISGYTGGPEKDPTYKQVAMGLTGHYEAVKIIYDPDRVSLAAILDVFWKHIDPTDPGGQFVDRGMQYRTAIFYANERQQELAEESKAALEASGRLDKPVVTEILPLGDFYPAEEYHQDYYLNNLFNYKRYRSGSGRDQFIDRVWGEEADHMPEEISSYAKPSDEEIKAMLTDLQYHVTQEDGTERPFDNTYWDNHQEGIYVDVVSGEPLFSSLDKFESGTGWPSFTTPLVSDNIVEIEDRSLGMVRVEVRSRNGDSHLGHVFPDGPPPTGLRYCMNSASMRFIPKEDLEAEGYGEFTGLFE